RSLWREPSWWLWWYPRSLRRAGNVWDRLPAAVRGARSSVFAFILFTIALYVDIAVSKALFGGEDMEPRYIVGARLDETPAQFGLTLLGSIVAALLLSTIRSRKMLAKAGLSAADANRIMLTVPPSRTTFWARPHVAAVLAPPTAERTSLDSPHDYLQSIRRDAEALSGPMRPLGGEAAVAARHLVDSVEDAERQIAGLARSIEPGEEERLSDRIEALGSADEYAPMRALLERQLQIVREMSGRIEEARERRNRRIEMLKTLALHMASLRERAAQPSSEARTLSDEVRGLCDEIGRQTQALGVPGGDFSTIGRVGGQ
ncbi:MAG TPA: hypothetical protein VFV54_11625, partial [Thermoanaerobaculia bacterium]|nr:hypothetical protein [Thermoanaerobaculia bacterium]